MDAKPERQMLPCVPALDIEHVCIIENLCVSIARRIPHQHLIACLNGFAAYFAIVVGRTPHIGERCLPPNDFSHHIGNQRWLFDQLVVLLGELVERIHAATHGVPRCVIAANDQ